MSPNSTKVNKMDALTGEPVARSSHPLGTNWFPGRYRWVICAVLLLGVTKNYMDRQVLGVLKNTLQHDLGWTEIDYSNLVFAFQCAYAVGMLAVGRFIDRVGTRLGYACAMVFWSLASMAHALAGSLTSFFFARGALGFGEAGVFPASVKTVAEWFPQKERALATGIFNAGSNLGAILTPLFIPWIAIHPGWTPTELAHIRSGQEDVSARMPWLRLLQYRQTWAFITAKFLTDPIWWFYLFWVPGFLQHEHGLNLAQI